MSTFNNTVVFSTLQPPQLWRPHTLWTAQAVFKEKLAHDKFYAGDYWLQSPGMQAMRDWANGGEAY